MTEDPVCGLQVEETKAITTDFKGKTFYFCAISCKDKFLKEASKIFRVGIIIGC